MREIKFPRSGKVLTAEEAGYTDMVNRVRDSEFEKHLHEGLYPAAQDKQKALASMFHGAGERGGSASLPVFSC
ncbi:hypothetical protein JSY14_01800 [Brachybacterium sp. EF45031]|uniref:hypothetical protein n=1 Tax=Brachybacterium sillae TaxID=2810536 RepID=UPI00217EB997|nr:hypothetical protein [Brachybacterium sillae]MCS6710815.1 hypothetical protein [Brachybacterium sillae]